jgi:hypothetical protein
MTAVASSWQPHHKDRASVSKLRTVLVALTVLIGGISFGVIYHNSRSGHDEAPATKLSLFQPPCSDAQQPYRFWKLTSEPDSFAKRKDGSWRNLTYQCGRVAWEGRWSTLAERRTFWPICPSKMFEHVARHDLRLFRCEWIQRREFHDHSWERAWEIG